MISRRRKRARKHIALRELLAAALSQLLPQAERDELREAKVPAKRIISLFTPDHVHLHALGGPDRWFNITMTRRGPELKAKDNRDTSIVAKSDRLVKSEKELGERLAAKLYGAPASTMMEDKPNGERRPARPGEVYWRKKRELKSRGFVKGHRPLRSQSSFQRRQP